MALGKQAKVLSRAQIDGTLSYIAKTRRPVRNRVIFLLSVKAGMRTKEIASLTSGVQEAGLTASGMRFFIER
jgi:integrase/recombinase XerD